MAEKARSPTRRSTYTQYSKRLATAISVFWIVFRAACLALLLLRPALAEGMKGVLQGADDVMMANIAFYCGNSVAEKGITGYFGRKSAEEAPMDESNG